MSIPAIAPISAVTHTAQAVQPGAAGPANGPSFVEMLSNGLSVTEAKLAKADELVAQFAIDDSIPVHRVTYALEEARISFELMLQVRNRLLEGTQQLMNMQL
ncbi:flagellar hook-basal body complex protein FliE [Novosphingobium sp. B 225]|uniref:flagellar hook-basal body complex protein FliE n=1 Tax=Novosphingobium sp. B 225 TaxID=1961849 RepID=UPI000B4B0C99|nr:flagellar hook-basal body complex protein FliE [Novosphingobium sp. B 225]